MLAPDKCILNRIFHIGSEERDSEIEQSLKLFPKRMFLFNELINTYNLKSGDIEFLSKDFYRKLSHETSGISEIDEENTRTEAWKHTYDFFNSLVTRSEHGINKKKSGRGKEVFCISDSLLKAFVSICCYQNNKSSEVFLDIFFEFLLRRGIDFNAESKNNIIAQLEADGLADILEDAGSARCVKTPFPPNTTIKP